MSDHLYKVIELVGSSPDGIEAAIQSAIGGASKSLYNLRWFEVLETRGHIEDGRVAHYQVRLKVGFRIGAADGSGGDFVELGAAPFNEGP
ncbi:hypothetical protein SAMN05444678_11913 [Sphingomonas sp. YR710]|jgi:flavin-binding protein dodecin|nr:dodecin [Sphingomonas sp. YR710]SDD68306.1 hypothetical protein SAMN05444678_11913 [Sphingomonas sp. YR710]